MHHPRETKQLERAAHPLSTCRLWGGMERGGLELVAGVLAGALSEGRVSVLGKELVSSEMFSCLNNQTQLLPKLG